MQFVPVQAKEKTILDLTLSPGYVYFATDTGKIFMDTGEERVSIGGSGAAVFYSFSSAVVERPDGSFWIPRGDLENETIMLKKSDLLINSDGRFFKIIGENVE